MPSVIFDLDGTLIDSAADIHAGANRALAAEGLAPLSYAQVRSFIGKGVPHLIERLLEASGQPTAGALHTRVMADFTHGYETAVALTTCYPGVIAALEALSARGYRLGLCTNKPLAPTHAVLRHLGLAPFFGAVFGGDSLPTRKPDPAPLHATAAALGSRPVIYVGDSEIDAETAQAAGVPFLLFTEGYRKTPVAELYHDACFDAFAQLPALIDGLKT